MLSSYGDMISLEEVDGVVHVFRTTALEIAKPSQQCSDDKAGIRRHSHYIARPVFC